MIARLLISSSVSRLQEEITKQLASHSSSGNVNHPDILYFGRSGKLGIAEARKIKDHFSLKPYSAKGRAVILEDVSVMTVEAQNALLKTIEELPGTAILVLGANSSANLLSTILSRCEISNLETANHDTLVYHSKYIQDLEKLLSFSIQERFEYVEKLKEKAGFLHDMVGYFRQILVQKITNYDATIQYNVTKIQIREFLKEMLQAEQRAKQNVNIRAILEYLMLVMPSKV